MGKKEFYYFKSAISILSATKIMKTLQRWCVAPKIEWVCKNF